MGLIAPLLRDEILPVVLTVQTEGFGSLDPSLENVVPLEVKVIKTKTWEPFNIYRRFLGKAPDTELVASETVSAHNRSLSHRISLWIRLNLFIPDARIGWFPYAVKAGIKIVQEERIRAIISFGPPHSTHLAAKRIAGKTCIPFIPVFIDPWTDIAYYRGLKRSALTLALDKRMERDTLQNAAKAAFVTETLKSEFENKYPFLRDRSHIIYWGYSEHLFENVIPLPARQHKIILHAGNIFDYQNPRLLWKYIARENELNPNSIRLNFIGTVSPGIKTAVKDAGIERFVDYLGFLPYGEMLRHVCSADYLLVCATEKRHVPGKLFEYLRSGRPILAFGDDNDEVRKILSGSKIGQLYAYDSNPEDFFSNFTGISPDYEFIKQFERGIVGQNFSADIKALFTKE